MTGPASRRLVALDAAIAEAEREIKQLRQLEADLAALKRMRARVAAQVMPVRATRAPRREPPRAQTQRRHLNGAPLRRGHTGASRLALQILEEAGGRPVHIGKILHELEQRGVPSKLGSISSELSRAVRAGDLVRLRRGVFATRQTSLPAAITDEGTELN